ncbi:hypothetical protein BZG02_15670 [Labilibaculum filiforme]|uniref:Glycoside hydrolase family 42 N-terminal domain-containing protein n=1 Tax=Labilibaculum filiforme TaxID=1940526 RepID=A0A2N3HTK5_9BACT|nr:T9SS type A sorting domain-containing protein [Labilibaculum filiforme]PKQ61395.1 hypothetical protein BZG02_15670 [Labilibaculum filiforme]
MKRKFISIAIVLFFFAIQLRAQTFEEKAQTKISRLQNLVTKAQTKGIYTEKEEMTLRTAEIFLKYANWDEEHTDINKSYFEKVAIYKNDASSLANNIADFERKEVIKILDLAIGTLNSLIDKEIFRKNIDKVDYSAANIDGNKIKMNNRPVFLSDHIWKPESEELIEFYGALDGEYISPSNITDENGTLNSWTSSRLSNKPSGNIGFVFLDHNNIPQWATNKYDNFTIGSRHYGKYDIDNPGAREMYSMLFKKTVPKMINKNYSKMGYMLFNEPSFFTAKGVWNTGEVSNYTKNKFKIWLKKKHNNISTLNSLWGSNYSSFNDINVTIPMATSKQGTGEWYDWMTFNNDRVTKWFYFLKNEIKKYDPKALMHIKLMPWLWTGDKKDHGMDFESLIRLCGISGCDAATGKSNFWNSHEEWMDTYAFNWRNMSMTFDFFKSIQPNHIILDTETHFLSTVNFRDLYLEPSYVRANYWLAHMHGMSAGVNWVWGREADGSIKSNVGEGYAGSILQQPGILNELHATLIDLNTFSEEITKIQEQSKPLRIYYSLANAIQRPSYMNDVYHTYEALYFEGIPLGFATDSILIEENPKNWKSIIIRETELVTNQEFDQLQNYLNGGGTIIMDSKSLKKNEYGQAHEVLRVGKGSIVYINSLSEMKTQAIELINSKGLDPEIIVTENNGVGRKGCIWRCVKNQAGNLVLSLVNIGKTEATITVKLKKPSFGTTCKDLITGVTVPSNIKLKPEEVYFVEIIDNAGVSTSIFDPKFNSTNMARLYPNPSSGDFNIDFDQTQNQVSLSINDLSGKTIYQQEYFSTNHIQYQIPNHPNGTYVIKVQSGNSFQSFLFLKQ